MNNPIEVNSPNQLENITWGYIIINLGKNFKN